MKTVSATQQWMQNHPNDVPCPRGAAAAKAWRRKRGLLACPGERTKYQLDRAKYEALMTVKRGERGPSRMLRAQQGASPVGSSHPLTPKEGERLDHGY